MSEEKKDSILVIKINPDRDSEGGPLLVNRLMAEVDGVSVSVCSIDVHKMNAGEDIVMATITLPVRFGY